MILVIHAPVAVIVGAVSPPARAESGCLREDGGANNSASYAIRKAPTGVQEDA